MYALGDIDMSTEDVEQLAYADCFGTNHLAALYWCEQTWDAGEDDPRCDPFENQNFVDKLRTLPLCADFDQFLRAQIDCTVDDEMQATFNCVEDPTLAPACALYANQTVVHLLTKRCPDLFPQTQRARAMQWAFYGSLSVGIVVLGGYFLARKR